MEWNNAKEQPPIDTNEVIVSDGEGSYAVAWYKVADMTWHAASDILDADNYDGGCCITINDNDILYWAGIQPPNTQMQSEAFWICKGCGSKQTTGLDQIRCLECERLR